VPRGWSICLILRLRPNGVAKIVLESMQELLLKLALQMTVITMKLAASGSARTFNLPKLLASTQVVCLTLVLSQPGFDGCY